MNVAKTTPRTARSYALAESEAPERRHRPLTAAESKVKAWIKRNHGVLTRIARHPEVKLSVQFVQRIAYNREARSRNLIVERMLLAKGCPLIQQKSLGL